MTTQASERSNIFKSIVIMAGVYSSQFKCEIKLNNCGQASTDGKVINIPKPTPDALDFTWGYCAHEAGHIAHSDVDLIISTKESDSKLGWLLNVIEDTRIEFEMIHQFPGVKRYFNSLFNKILKYTPNDGSGNDLGDYIFYYVRGKITGYPIWDSATLALESKVNQEVDGNLMSSLRDKMDTIPMLTSTLACYNLAVDIMELIKQANDGGDASEASNQTGDGGDASEASNQTGDGGDASKASNQTGDGGDASKASNQTGDDGDASKASNQTGDDGDASKASNPNPASKFLSSEINSLPEGDLGKQIEKLLNAPENQEAMTDEERLYISKGDIHSVTAQQATIESFESVAKQTTTHLRHALVKLLESETRTQKVTTKRGRRVARSKTARLLTGNTRIFKRKYQNKEDINSELVILADASGSMGSNIENVKIATHALLSCLDNLEGASSSAFAFYNEQVTTLKDSAESFSPNVKARVASLMPYGGTPATQAYWVAAQSLINSRAQTKVIIMVTDGEPDDIQSTQNMVSSIKEAGVNVICLGVGVNSRAPKALDYIYGANQWLNVPDFGALAKELLKVAKAVI